MLPFLLLEDVYAIPAHALRRAHEDRLEAQYAPYGEWKERVEARFREVERFLARIHAYRHALTPREIQRVHEEVKKRIREGRKR